MAAKDPFPKTATPVVSGPAVEKEDNWVSVTFVSAAGYDRIAATFHGTDEFLAQKFNIQGYDGKASTLMKKFIAVDDWFKGEAAKASPGKA